MTPDPSSKQEQERDRDREILAFVGEVGIASSRHIQRLAFPVLDGGTAASAARRCRRVLARLTEAGLLGRLQRRIGGVRAGSAGHLYQLATKGRRVLGLGGRGGTWEPGSRHLDHALAVTELHVQLVEQQRAGVIERLAVTHEPQTWRRFSTPAGIVTLKPDVLVELTTADGWELRWFIEVDRATEHLPTVIRKCQRYQAYWRSGRESQRHEVFPRVAWVVPHDRRADAIRDAIARSRTLTPELFITVTAQRAAGVLTTSTND